MKTLLAAGCLILSGCATIPAVTTTPLVGQTPGQIQRDERECAIAARPTRTFWHPDGAAPVFEACMIARGYRAVVSYARYARRPDFFPSFPWRMASIDEVRVPIRIIPIFKLEAARAVSANETLLALQECLDASREVTSSADREWLYYSPGWIRPGLLDKIAAAYAACMEPKGYKTSIWEPPAR